MIPLSLPLVAPLKLIYSHLEMHRMFKCNKEIEPKDIRYPFHCERDQMEFSSKGLYLNAQNMRQVPDQSRKSPELPWRAE